MAGRTVILAVFVSPASLVFHTFSFTYSIDNRETWAFWKQQLCNKTDFIHSCILTKNELLAKQPCVFIYHKQHTTYGGNGFFISTKVAMFGFVIHWYLITISWSTNLGKYFVPLRYLSKIRCFVNYSCMNKLVWTYKKLPRIIRYSPDSNTYFKIWLLRFVLRVWSSS